MNTSQGGLVLLAVCMSLSFELVATLTKKKKKKRGPSFLSNYENFTLTRSLIQYFQSPIASCGLINAEFCQIADHLCSIFRLCAQK